MLNSVSGNTRQRLTAQDRRKQLVGLGLRMLATRPIHQLSVDAVAEQAGISRGLLFHYFPTKRDFYVEVMRAAARRLLRQTRPDPALPPIQQLQAMLTAYVAFVDRRRESYISFVRGAAGGDDFVVEVYDETRAALTARVLETLGDSDAGEVTRMTVHAWFAYVEDLAIEWSALAERPMTADELVGLAVRSLDALRGLAVSEAPD
jgi:AcrR family transcriptional regulator